MKNGPHLEVVASIKDMNTDLNREFEVDSEEYNQVSRGFCPSKKSNLLRVKRVKWYYVLAIQNDKYKNIA